MFFFFFFQAEDGIRDKLVTGVQTCALPISLATASQRADAREGLKRLQVEGKVVFEKEALPSKGFFLSPTLVEAASGAKAVHEHEVFGPVATLLAYSGHPEKLVTLGNGGLVCSLYSEDQ